MAVGVDADRDQGVDVDHAAALADLLGQGVDPHEGVGAGVERAVAELSHPGVEHLGHLGDL